MFNQIDWPQVLTWVIIGCSIIAMLLFSALLFITLARLAKIIMETSMDPKTNTVSATNLQRWITFVVLMFLWVISKIDVQVQPFFHINTRSLKELEIFIFLTFVAVGKVLKIWENRPGNDSTVETSTTVIEKAPEQKTTIKKTVNVNPPAASSEPDFVLQK